MFLSHLSTLTGLPVGCVSLFYEYEYIARHTSSANEALSHLPPSSL